MGSDGSADNEQSLAQAPERFGLRRLTAQEIAIHMHQPVELIMNGAAVAALRDGCSIDTVLHDWFRGLLTYRDAPQPTRFGGMPRTTETSLTPDKTP